MNETTKTIKILTDLEKSYLNGDGIDIGCGNDPIFPHVRPFDVIHGDANKISKHVDRQYDFVFSSHCLEHMHEPEAVLKEWYSIVKPGGYLYVIVPDEDLYEQGVFPSRYNPDHKWTFTINKRESWSPKSINLLQTAKNLNGEIVSLELQDHNFDYSLFQHGYNWWNFRLWKWFKKVSKPFRGTFVENILAKLYRSLGSTFDQTWMGNNRLAQIQLIVRKPIN
jgi:SAM-dependent methyltransferase